MCACLYSYFYLGLRSKRPRSTVVSCKRSWLGSGRFTIPGLFHTTRTWSWTANSGPRPQGPRCHRACQWGGTVLLRVNCLTTPLTPVFIGFRSLGSGGFRRITSLRGRSPVGLMAPSLFEQAPWSAALEVLVRLRNPRGAPDARASHDYSLDQGCEWAQAAWSRLLARTGTRHVPGSQSVLVDYVLLVLLGCLVQYWSAQDIRHIKVVQTPRELLPEAVAGQLAQPPARIRERLVALCTLTNTPPSSVLPPLAAIFHHALSCHRVHVVFPSLDLLVPGLVESVQASYRARTALAPQSRVVPGPWAGFHDLVAGVCVLISKHYPQYRLAPRLLVAYTWYRSSASLRQRMRQVERLLGTLPSLPAPSISGPSPAAVPPPHLQPLSKTRPSPVVHEAPISEAPATGLLLLSSSSSSDSIHALGSTKPAGLQGESPAPSSPPTDLIASRYYSVLPSPEDPSAAAEHWSLDQLRKISTTLTARQLRALSGEVGTG